MLERERENCSKLELSKKDSAVERESTPRECCTQMQQLPLKVLDDAFCLLFGPNRVAISCGVVEV